MNRDGNSSDPDVRYNYP